jgi:alkylated DNA nucleotide flippase Atl1
MDTEEYVEQVLCLVEQVPRGRATTYGLIAEAVGAHGPRQVGWVMSRYGAAVPWWRVVNAAGALPEFHQDAARQAYLEEGTPLRPSGSVDLREAVWLPDLPEVTPGSEPDRPARPGPAGTPQQEE